MPKSCGGGRKWSEIGETSGSGQVEYLLGLHDEWRRDSCVTECVKEFLENVWRLRERENERQLQGPGAPQ